MNEAVIKRHTDTLGITSDELMHGLPVEYVEFAFQYTDSGKAYIRLVNEAKEVLAELIDKLRDPEKVEQLEDAGFDVAHVRATITNEASSLTSDFEKSANVAQVAIRDAHIDALYAAKGIPVGKKNASGEPAVIQIKTGDLGL